MFRRGILAARRIWKLSCMSLVMWPAMVRGEGSILFNGGTSKLQNDTADVLDGSSNVTICVWVKADGIGGTSSRGLVFSLDETAGKLNLGHHTSADTMNWSVAFDGGNGVWTFPVDDEVWRAVSLVYNKSDIDNDPTVRVNFAEVMETETTPMGNPVAMAAGYCVGNETTQAYGWDGEIAHLQVFNRILSAPEQDACLREPGSVTNGLRMWLPLMHGTDIDDRSVNRFHGTATDLATGASGPAIFTHPLGSPAGIVFLTAGILPVTQFEILRYADGTNHPGGQLRGTGPASVLRASSATGSLSSSPVDSRAVVMTEDYAYPNNIDYWQAGAFGYPITGNISSATGQNPITVNTTAAHGLTSGQIVTISGVSGKPETNGGPFVITVPDADPDTFTIPVETSSGTGSGGMWSFDQRDAVLQAQLRDLTIAGYADAGATDTYAGRGIIDSQPGRFHKTSSTITALSGAVSTAVDDITEIIINTVKPHGLISGWTVEITGVTGNPEAIGSFVVTVPASDPDSFTIPVGGGSQTGTGGAWRLVGATNTSPIVITSYEHSLVDDASVTISGVAGTSTSIDGTYTITRVNDHQFSLDSTTAKGNGRNGSWTSNHWADREHGALVRSSGVHVENVNFYYIPGTCLVVATGIGPENRAGSIRPFDSEKARIWNCQFARGYRGAEIAMVDAIVGRLNGFGLRDYGVKFVYGGAQIDGALHFYGIGEGTPDAPAVWFASTAGPSWGGPIYAETSPVGLRIDSSGNKLTGFYSHTCYLRNLLLGGQRNTVDNFEIDVYDGVTENSGGEAVLISGHSITLSNGTFGGQHPVPAGETAIRLRNGT